MKLTPKQEELLQLLRDGWTVYPSEYRGRFGTSPAYCTKKREDGVYLPRVHITQHTIDALKRRGLVKSDGPMHNRVIVLVDPPPIIGRVHEADAPPSDPVRETAAWAGKASRQACKPSSTRS